MTDVTVDVTEIQVVEVVTSDDISVVEVTIPGPQGATSSGGGGGASAFTDLTDAPSNYTGDALKVVRVNSGETGLEFATNREVLAADRTYYVRTDGSDSNTGLANTAGGAFLTLQKAVDTILGLDFGSDDPDRTVTVQIADGTYDGLTEIGSITGIGYIFVQGNDTNPENVILTNTLTTSGTNIYNVMEINGGNARVKISGVTFTPKNAANVTSWSLLTGDGAVVQYGNTLNFKNANPNIGQFYVALNSSFGSAIRPISAFTSTMHFEGDWTKFLEAEYLGHIDYLVNHLWWDNTPIISTVIHSDQLSAVQWVIFTQHGSVDPLSTPLYAAQYGKIISASNIPGSGTSTLELGGGWDERVGGLKKFYNATNLALEMTQDVGTTFGDAPTGTIGRGNIAFNTGKGIMDAAGNEQVLFTQTSSAVNYFNVTNSAANGVQRLEAAGGDTNIAVTIASKGTDPINLEVNGNTEASLTASNFTPGANDGNALGVTGTRWADLFLADGGVVDIGTTTSRATITHTAASDSITIAADPDNSTASSQVILQVDGTSEAVLDSTNFKPGANDGNALGASGTAWSDLFLASGGVINWNAGNATITHSAGALTSNVDISVPDEVYGVGWDASLEVPTKNAVYDKIESISAGAITWPQAVADGVVFTGNTVDSPGHADPILALESTGDGVNYLTISNADTGSGPVIGTAGDDANVPLTIRGKPTTDFTSGITFDLGGTFEGGTFDFRTANKAIEGGPIFYINSQQSASADSNAQWWFAAKDSAGNDQFYQEVTFKIADSTSGSEDGHIRWRTSVAGTMTTQVVIANGVYFGSSHDTFTDPGNGNIRVTNIEFGGATATDTTLTRSSAGNLSIEGNVIYRAGGTDVPLADGGTGASLTDPNLDRLMFWDDSAGTVKFAALADITTEAAPATGDYLLIHRAEDDVAKVDWGSLPSASTNIKTSAVGITIDGGGSVITTGIKGDITVPYDCTITGWTLLADQTGSIEIDVWKDTYANYPPTVADTIFNESCPRIVSAAKAKDTDFADSPAADITTITAGDTLRFNVNSVSAITRCNLVLTVVKT